MLFISRTQPAPRHVRRRTSFMAALAVSSLVSALGVQSAWAYDLTGRWIAAGMSDNGPISYRLGFGPDGSFQSEFSTGNNPRQYGSTSGMTRCVGAYRFNGQVIETRVTACQQCSASGCSQGLMPIGVPSGPVMFQGPNLLMVNGATLQRQ